VPLSAYVAAKGDWHSVMWMGAIANVVVAILAIIVLKPMRKRMRSAVSP
jgi:predicted MFS family arabinose efflux permease